MPLSEYEQRVLEQMEQQLTSDDPKLANTFHGRASNGVRRWLLTGTGALLGLTILVIGAATSTPWLGVLGFIGMFVAVVMAFSPPRGSGPSGVVDADGTVKARSPKKASTGGSPGFLARFEERWERRRDSGGQ